MKRQYKLIIAALGVVAILIAAIATTALAAQKANAPGAAAPTEADYQAWGCPVANGDYQAVAALLGMTTQEIEAQLEQGKSLAEIAASKGVSEDQLVAVIIDPMKQFMQQQVTGGYWTQAQMDSHLKQAEQHIRQLVNATGNGAGYGGCGGYGGVNGMMGGWGANGTASGAAANNSGSFQRGGMMGGSGGMMGGWGTNSNGSFGRGGMMGGWY